MINPSGVAYAVNDMFNQFGTTFNSGTTGVKIMGTGFAINFLNYLNQGTTGDRRVGNKIVLKSIYFKPRLQFTTQPEYSIASLNIDYHICCDLMLYNGEVPTSPGATIYSMTNFWQTLIGYNEPTRIAFGHGTRDPGVMQNWRLLKRWRHKLTPGLPRVSYSITDTAYYFDPCLIPDWSVKFKKGLEVEWDPGLTAPHNYTNRTLFYIIYSNCPANLTISVVPTIVAYDARIFFYDM